MAAYIPVPRDLTRVKSKLFFNLTKRQLLCFGTAALIGVPSFFLLHSATGNTSLATLGMMILMMPLFLLAMYEKNGQPDGGGSQALLGRKVQAAQDQTLSNRQLLFRPYAAGPA